MPEGSQGLINPGVDIIKLALTTRLTSENGTVLRGFSGNDVLRMRVRVVEAITYP